MLIRGHERFEIWNGAFMGLILLILLVLLLVGGLPRWGYSRKWGYGPTGGVGFVLFIVIILIFMGRL
jgi:hypothetical protein